MRLLVLIILAVFQAKAHAAGMGREQALAEFKTLKSQNTQSLRDLESRLKSLLTPNSTLVLNASLSFNEPEIERINQERQERMLKQELLDRMIMQIDTKFKSGDLRGFLAARLSEMARTDLLANSSKQNLWKQMSYLGQALRDLPERGDNIVSFVDGYLRRSSFKYPLKPEEYLRERQYTNSRESVAAVPTSKEEVGELLEDRLNQLDQAEQPTPAPPTVTTPTR